MVGKALFSLKPNRATLNLIFGFLFVYFYLTSSRHEGSALFDIHDRVNYAAKNAEFVLDAENKTISFRIDIDEEFSSTVEYFEIFLERMLLCKKAAAVLDLRFRLIINGAKMI